MAVSPWLCLLFLSCLAVYSSADVVRAEFESCPACRLNSLPQVKKFLFKVVSKGIYPNVTVKWLHGRTPELVLYDQADKEVERMFIDKLTFNDLHTLLKQKGFRPKTDDPEAIVPSKDKPQLTTVLQQPSHEATASDAATATVATSSATASRRALQGSSTGHRWLKTLVDVPGTKSLDLDA